MTRVLQHRRTADGVHCGRTLLVDTLVEPFFRVFGAFSRVFDALFRATAATAVALEHLLDLEQRLAPSLGQEPGHEARGHRGSGREQPHDLIGVQRRHQARRHFNGDEYEKVTQRRH